MYSIIAVMKRARKYVKENPELKHDPKGLKSLLHDDFGAMSSSKILDTIIVIVVGLYAVAYVLPGAMSALGLANTSNWPTGTSELITPIGIFVMIGLLILFAKSGGQK